MTTLVTKTQIKNKFPVLDDVFTEYLTESYNTIKPYTSYPISLFIPPFKSDCINYAKTTLPSSSKTIPLKVTKFFDNQHVSFNENNDLHLTLDAPGVSTMHVINTGLSFNLDDNQTLCISNPNPIYEDFSMNPVIIDKQTTMPIILCISTDGTVPECVLNVDLFGNNNNKYLINDVKQSIINGTVKNIKCPSILDITEGQENGKNHTIQVNNTAIELFPGTALLMTLRKRHHRNIQLPLVGAVAPKKETDTSKFKLFLGNHAEVPASYYSYTVVQGYYPKFNIVNNESEQDCSENGGYNGWFQIYDPNYDEVVQLYKNSSKIMKSLKLVKMVLSKYNWNTKENIDWIMKTCNKKSLKGLHVQCNTTAKTFEEFMQTIDLTPPIVPLNTLIANMIRAMDELLFQKAVNDLMGSKNTTVLLMDSKKGKKEVEAEAEAKVEAEVKAEVEAEAEASLKIKQEEEEAKSETPETSEGGEEEEEENSNANSNSNSFIEDEAVEMEDEDEDEDDEDDDEEEEGEEEEPKKQEESGTTMNLENMGQKRINLNDGSILEFKIMKLDMDK